MLVLLLSLVRARPRGMANLGTSSSPEKQGAFTDLRPEIATGKRIIRESDWILYASELLQRQFVRLEFSTV